MSIFLTFSQIRHLTMPTKSKSVGVDTLKQEPNDKNARISQKSVKKFARLETFVLTLHRISQNMVC